jgi:hypothetical protein
VPRQKRSVPLPRASTPPPSTPPSTPSSSAVVPPELSPSWPSLSSDTPPKGASFFRARGSNVLNFVPGLDADWKEVFRGSSILSWKLDDDRGSGGYRPSIEVDPRVSPIGLRTVVPSRVDDTASALRALCDSGPLNDADGVHYPIVGRTAKLRTIQRGDILQAHLTVNDPFPYLYHGSDLDGGGPALRAFPAAQLTGQCGCHRN